MKIISPAIQDYAEKHTEEEPKLLQELHRETWQKVLAPRMISGHLQGRFLSMISKMIKPKAILEIGTYTGYATLCLAEGLAESGLICTIDKNEELVDIQNKYFKRAGFSKLITQYTGNALNILPEINQNFDLVFIDADKTNYSRYFDQIIDKVNTGGIILSDNVLWSGKVLNKSVENDLETKEIIAYNAKMKADKRIEMLLLPIRDGISIGRKL